MVDSVRDGDVAASTVETTDLTVAGGPRGEVSIRIYRPAGSVGVLPVVLDTHGAGWVFGDAHTHDRLARELGRGQVLPHQSHDGRRGGQPCPTVVGGVSGPSTQGEDRDDRIRLAGVTGRGMVLQQRSVADFWGAFDLASTRFSSRSAAPHPGGMANCPDWVMTVAYDQLGEFVLPYAAVCSAADPDGTLTTFLGSAFGAAAELADRPAGRTRVLSR